MKINMFILLNFPLVNLKTWWGFCSESQGQMLASSSLSEPESTLEAPTSKDALGDCDGPGCFANFCPKTAEKTKFLRTLRFLQTFYF